MIATIKGVTTTTLTLSVKKLLGRPNAIAPLAMPVTEVSQHLARCGHKDTPKLFRRAQMHNNNSSREQKKIIAAGWSTSVSEQCFEYAPQRMDSIGTHSLNTTALKRSRVRAAGGNFLPFSIITKQAIVDGVYYSESKRTRTYGVNIGTPVHLLRIFANRFCHDQGKCKEKR